MKIPADKAGHFAVGAFFGASAWWIGVWAIVPVMIYAVGKEIYDACHPRFHTVDKWDAAATLVGGTVSILIVLYAKSHP